jgi:Protein required for attachment to host cells
MSRKKTQQGVEMRSTYGMNQGKKAKSWVVYMNRAQARVYEWHFEENNFKLIHSWEFPQGRMKGSDLISDQPGRVFDSRTSSKGGHQTASPRHSYSQRENPQTRVAKTSVRTVSEWVETNKTKNGIDKLFCVASPKLMGLFHAQLEKRYRDQIERTWERDFGWMDEAQLQKRLFAWVTGKEKPQRRMLPKSIGATGVSQKEGKHGMG